ncbi:MAG TPA: response regulator transcription factor [Leptolyngbyaceae cyanobacterium M33_DOE_097]|uniref:Response regulator transcription factor n=1 Tax=Oscillatoriales cyanobacterium SpSt-418 TaxID=2282169 RepID=A0A7C3PR99_9CYAN|nr:response regulator transcription factor [Leptolyngbyaceae cyanobacterium M33_DOE_097]
MVVSINPKKVKVLLVDDHELTLLSLQLALSNYSEMEVTGLASNGLEAVEKARSLHPDVVLLDLQMPVMDGFSASTQIKQLCPDTKILAYSSLKDQRAAIAHQMQSFDGFCGKDVSTFDLFCLIKQLGNQAEVHSN